MQFKLLFFHAYILLNNSNLSLIICYVQCFLSPIKMYNWNFTYFMNINLIWKTLWRSFINFGFAEFQAVSFKLHHYRSFMYRKLSKIYLLEYLELSKSPYSPCTGKAFFYDWWISLNVNFLPILAVINMTDIDSLPKTLL